jgi:hypothetical protein
VDQRAGENPFLARVLRGSAYHILRWLKYKVRIPVPKLPIGRRAPDEADEERGYIMLLEYNKITMIECLNKDLENYSY